MRFAALVLLVMVSGISGLKAGAAYSSQSTVGHLRVSGTRFISPDGSTFRWRGISAFRLLEFVAHGRENEADAYLKWAASKRLTVVRVFAMADGIFQLTPADGARALPRLLEMARKHGMYVEVVAFTGTSVITVDRAAFVKAIAAICAQHSNALLELANEPGHPTQAKEMHNPAHLQSLLPHVPKGVPVALGSVEYHDGFAAGTYVTWHSPRGSDWVKQVEEGAALMKKFGKPLINDEPIGAADAPQPGRRDSDPARFRAAAAAMRRAGVGATFHYDGGIQTRLPTKGEMACLDAWLAGLGTGNR
ncbi:MAG TPA: hypothetical protein VFK57_07480 [Vicinamibacterales bacterium]|nr:hypothetical protein [Vicinamibacterales bacterium]